MSKRKKPATRRERACGTGRFVKTGTNKRKPKTTVTEKRKKKKT